MILFLQFTVTDTRYFSTFNSELLQKPQWPSPRPFREFVRNGGAIVERNKGGLTGWVGENFVCRIKNTIKFPKETIISNGVRIANISKHMYATEHYILTKYEFVFNINTTYLESAIDFKVMKDIINELLMSQVALKLNGKLTYIRVDELPIALKHFHYQNTTKRDGIEDKASLPNLMLCTPQCYFYLERNENSIGLDRNYKHIANISKIAQLFSGWHNYRNNPFRIWIHQRRIKSAMVTENRELRMTIMRLHSEYECLRNCFLAISNGLITVDERSALSDELQSYFNDAIRTFLNDEKNLEYQSWTPGFFNYFSKIYELASPGELEKVRLQINAFHFRANIKNKIINQIYKTKFMSKKKFVNNNSTIISQGDNNNVHHNQVYQTADDAIDYDTLLKELVVVLEEAKKEATTTEGLKSVLALSEAKDAAEKKDAGGVIAALNMAGKFVADIATKLTASVIVELMKSHTTWLS